MAQPLRVLNTVRLSPPATALPDAPLPLSGLDADRNVLDVAFRTLRFFPPPPPDHPSSLDVLPRAFEAALALFPTLAGRLLRDDDGRHAVVVSDTDAVPLVLAESDLSVGDVDTDVPGSALLDGLAPPVGDGNDGERPALALQATWLACGGVALGMRVAHALCDGAGATMFLAAAARFARGQGPPEAAPLWDRRDLLGPREPPRVVTPFFERVLAALDDDGMARDGHDAHTQQQEDGEVTRRECFHVSDERVETLRAQLAGEAGLKLTTFEVVAAFIWRARVKAKGTSSGDVVKMVYSMNISKLVDPPLPAGYWGNVCVPVYVALPAGDLLSQPLAATAALIRNSKREVTDEYVRSYVDFLELLQRRGVTAAGAAAVSAFTDWRRLGHGEVDLGWGGPTVVLPLSWSILGSAEPCFLLPYGANNLRRRRGFKVFVAVRDRALQGFREEMAELLLLQHQSSVGKL